MPNQWQRRCVLPSYGEPYFVERQWRLTFFKSLNFYAVVRRVWQAAPGIVFTTCMSVHSFVHLLPNLSTRYFESEWTDFDANWQSSPQGNGMKRSTSGSVGQRSRSHKQKIDCSRHCKCWPWKGSHGAVHRFSCPRMAGERLADALVWFCMDCCDLVHNKLKHKLYCFILCCWSDKSN